MWSGPDRCRPDGSADKWPSARPQRAETSSAPDANGRARLPAQPCASLLRDSLHRHLGCVMREPGAGPATRRQRRCTTPIKPLPTAGTAALRPTTRTLGHRRLNIHASQPCKENARTCREWSGVRMYHFTRPGGRVAPARRTLYS